MYLVQGDERGIGGETLLIHNVFVYGTLKRGHRLHGRMAPCEYRGEAVVRGLTLMDLGPFPAAVRNPTGKIRGEVYRVSTSVLETLDSVERGYDRLRKTTDEGLEVYVYVMDAERFTHLAPGYWIPIGEQWPEVPPMAERLIEAGERVTEWAVHAVAKVNTWLQRKRLAKVKYRRDARRRAFVATATGESR
jgi:gamma-glutamylcyclotransferase (GGCT)/AIG2-like uncharacterized protein YtfP